MPIKKKTVVLFPIPASRFVGDRALWKEHDQSRREFYAGWSQEDLIERLLETERVLDAVDHLRRRHFHDLTNKTLGHQRGAEKKNEGDKAHQAKDDIKRYWEHWEEKRISTKKRPRPTVQQFAMEVAEKWVGTSEDTIKKWVTGWRKEAKTLRSSVK